MPDLKQHILSALSPSVKIKTYLRSLADLWIISTYSDKKTLSMIDFVPFFARLRLDTRSVNLSAGSNLSLFPPDLLRQGSPNYLIYSILHRLLSIKKPAERLSVSLPPDSILSWYCRHGFYVVQYNVLPALCQCIRLLIHTCTRSDAFPPCHFYLKHYTLNKKP